MDNWKDFQKEFQPNMIFVSGPTVRANSYICCDFIELKENSKST